MRETVIEGKTVESAIQAGLKELKCSREQAEIEVIQEPVKGIFGMAKMAKVKITCTIEIPEPRPMKKDEAEEEEEEVLEPGTTTPSRAAIEIQEADLNEKTRKAKENLLKILELMDIQDARIRVSQEESNIYLDIYSEAEGLLIGRHGQTLSSLQYLLNRMVNHDSQDSNRFLVDIGGYRDRHRIILEKMAAKVAKRVVETNEEEELKAMSAFDRRIVHMSVKDNPGVVSYSLGEGSFRRVVIAPRAKYEEKHQKAE